MNHVLSLPTISFDEHILMSLPTYVNAYVSFILESFLYLSLV